MQKKGAVLLEVLLAGAISSMVSLILLTVWIQMHGTQVQVDRTINDAVRFQTVYHWLERDLMGITLPVLSPIKSLEKNNSGNEVVEKKDQQPETAPLIPLIGTQEKGQCNQLILISHHALHWYSDNKQSIPTPALVKITYSLKEDQNRNGSYQWYRQETSQLSQDTQVLSKEKPEQMPLSAHIVIDNIKSLIIEYHYFPKNKGDKQGNENTALKETNTTLAVTDHWPDEKIAKEKSAIPTHIKVMMTVWDQNYTKEKKQIFLFAIPPSLVINTDKTVTLQSTPTRGVTQKSSSIKIAQANKNTQSKQPERKS